MALKSRISKEAFDSLDDKVKEFYVEKNGSYFLDLEADDGFANLKKEKKELQDKLAAALSQLDDEKEGKMKKDGDIKALEESYKQKLEAQRLKLTKTLESDRKFIGKLILENKATELAGKLFGENAKLGLPHILSRLQHEVLNVDGQNEHNLKILDASGKLSALTLDDLEKEIVADSNFKSILKATSASGGAVKPPSGSGTPAAGSGEKAPDLATMAPEQLAAHINRILEK